MLYFFPALITTKSLSSVKRGFRTSGQSKCCRNVGAGPKIWNFNYSQYLLFPFSPFPFLTSHFLSFSLHPLSLPSHFPFPLPFPPFPSLPFPLNAARGPRERCMLPSGYSTVFKKSTMTWSPAAKCFLLHFQLMNGPTVTLQINVKNLSV